MGTVFFGEKTTLKLKHVANGTVLADTLGKPKLCGSEQVQMRFKVQSSILLLIFFVLGILGFLGFLGSLGSFGSFGLLFSLPFAGFFLKVASNILG